MASRRSEKRRRNDSPEDEHIKQPIPSQPWFEDGNVILEAEATQFCVYRGILAANSTVFKDMFEFAQPEGDGSVGGCPVVKLSDSAEDLQHVLMVLHDAQSSSRFAIKVSRPLAKIAAFLRLGSKYQISHLRAEAMRRLCADFPSTLQQFDKHMKQSANISSHLGHLFDVINLAREHEITLILPAVFYMYCRYHFDIKMVFDGILRTDPKESPARLTPEDQRACLLGWQRLLDEQTRMSFLWLDPTKGATLFEHCRRRSRCEMARKELLIDLWHPAPKFMSLDAWDSDWEDGMCQNCITAAIRSQEDGRGKIWNRLPSSFGLPPWPELLAEETRKEQSLQVLPD